MKLQALTTVREEARVSPHGDHTYMANASRCVGVYTDFKTAERDVLENVFDIYEQGYYPYAVIEEIESDHLYGGVPDDDAEDWGMRWFEWIGDMETGGYKPCPCPDKYKNMVGFWG